MSAKVFKQNPSRINNPEDREEPAKCADDDAIALQAAFRKVLLLIREGRGIGVWLCVLVEETFSALIGGALGVRCNVMCGGVRRVYGGLFDIVVWSSARNFIVCVVF
jgi:hypothetical protein